MCRKNTVHNNVLMYNILYTSIRSRIDCVKKTTRYIELKITYR